MKKTKFKKNAQNITHKPETCLNSGENELARVMLSDFYEIQTDEDKIFHSFRQIRLRPCLQGGRVTLLPG